MRGLALTIADPAFLRARGLPGSPYMHINFRNLDGSNNSTLTDGGAAPANIVNHGSAGGTFARVAGAGIYRTSPFPLLELDGLTYWDLSGGTLAATSATTVISAVVRATGGGNTQRIFSMGRPGVANDGDLSRIDQVGISRWACTHSNEIFDTVAVTLNQWERLIGRATADKTLDVSGRLTSTLGGGVSGGTATKVRLGGEMGGSAGQFWTGRIGLDLVVWRVNDVPTDAAIDAYYDAAALPNVFPFA